MSHSTRHNKADSTAQGCLLSCKRPPPRLQIQFAANDSAHIRRADRRLHCSKPLRSQVVLRCLTTWRCELPHPECHQFISRVTSKCRWSSWPPPSAWKVASECPSPRESATCRGITPRLALDPSLRVGLIPAPSPKPGGSSDLEFPADTKHQKQRCNIILPALPSQTAAGLHLAVKEFTEQLCPTESCCRLIPWASCRCA